MKLILDVFRVVVVGLVLWFVTATVLAGGSVGYDLVRKGERELLCSVAECQAEVDARHAVVEEADTLLQQAERARDHAYQKLTKARQEATLRLDALRQREHDVAQAQSLMVRQNQKQFQELNLADSFAGWSPAENPERRNDLFVTTCVRVSAWSSKRCETVLDDAKVTPKTATGLTQLTHDAWGQRVAESLRSTCETKIIGMVENILNYCTAQRVAVQGGFLTIQGFLASADRYALLEQQVASIRNQISEEDQALARLLGDETYENAVVDARNHAAQVREQYEAAQERLLEAQRDPWRVVVSWRDAYWGFVRPYAIAALVLLLANFFWRPAAYFLVAPWIRYAGRLRLLPENDTTDAVLIDADRAESTTPAPVSARLIATAGNRQRNIYLRPEERLWVRPEYVTSSRGGGSTWIYGGFRHPFTSYAAGLTGMTYFIGATRSKIAIGGTGEEHSNQYIGSIELENHPGFALRPRHIVAIQGDLKIRFRWSFKLMSLLRGQLRHAVFSGTGAVYVVGNGGVFPQIVGDPDVGRVHGQPSDQLKDALIVGWDARVEVSLRRNENWIHVALLRRDEMFETSLLGEGVYVQTHSTPRRRTDVVGRLFEGILSAIGKVLGI